MIYFITSAPMLKIPDFLKDYFGHINTSLFNSFLKPMPMVRSKCQPVPYFDIAIEKGFRYPGEP